MRILAAVLVALVGALHVGFMILEMFLWDGPIGQRVFAMTPEQSATTAVLAANQGLYNGILAAGLFWAAFSRRHDLQVFFLVAAILAGIFGAISAKGSILFTQSAPALIALLASLAAGPNAPRA